jgi:hypothetical protein
MFARLTISADGIMLAFTLLLLTGVISYLPTHLRFLQRRAAYYLLGDDARDLYGVVRGLAASAYGGSGRPDL